MYENIIIVLADTRVGSTALGRGISDGVNTHFLGEILYPEVAHSKTHFYGPAIELEFSRILQSKDVVFDALDAFFMRSLDAGSRHVADIKYHDLKIFPYHPTGLLDRPLILDHLVNRGCRIIHLNRRNKLAAALSQEVALQTKFFHADLGTDHGLGRELSIDIERLVSGAIMRERSHQLVRQWLRDYDQVLDVEYEALFTTKGFSDLHSFFKDEWTLPDVTYEEKLQRVSDIRDVRIKNTDEIEACFDGLPWTFDVQEALSGYRARES